MAMSKGIGSLQMWGFSAAKNLLDFFESPPEPNELGRESLNIILFGETDLRHCLKTLESNWDSDQNQCRQPINFYIVENSLDLYARQMALWKLAMESLNEKGLLEKTTQFIDLYGNLFIRPQTKKYLMNTCEKLVKFISDDKEVGAEFPMFSLDFLKFRERDQLIDILKFWLKNSENNDKMDLAKIWDNRLRQHLEIRYDSRFGVFDWDYNMNLINKGANVGIISLHEYKTWRNTGIAFGEYEADYSQPNLTLTSGALTPAHNYWGDIVTGPFISHSIECSKMDYFNKVNHKFQSTALDVIKYNIENIFRNISPKTTEERTKILNTFKINFVSLSKLNSLIISHEKFIGKFDLAYFSNSMVQYLATKNFKQILKDDAIIVVEDSRFILELRPEQTKVFDDKVLEICTEAGFEEIRLHDRGIGDGDGDTDTATALKDQFNCFKRFRKVLVE